MAKYSIAHSCGHDAEVNITGTNVHGERDRKAEWLAGQPCGNCSAGQRAREAAQAAARNAPARLLALVGSRAHALDTEELCNRALAALTETIRFHGAAHLENQLMAVYLRPGRGPGG